MSHLPRPSFNVPGRSAPMEDLPHPAYETPKRGPQRAKIMRQPSGFWHAIWIPGLLLAMWTGFRHTWQKKFTIQWPEETREVSDNYRGVHRLNKDEQGRVKCVACFLCQAACPANCIRIEGAKAPWPDREKYPVRFHLDELRCVYCGQCEEACPEDAIELTRIYSLVGESRAEMIYDKEQLLAIYDLTREQKHPVRW